MAISLQNSRRLPRIFQGVVMRNEEAGHFLSLLQIMTSKEFTFLNRWLIERIHFQ